MKELILGTKHVQTLTVTQNQTAKAMGSGDLDVFATPAMVAFIENTAKNALAPYLDDGESSVGTNMEVRHLAASPVGMEVTCSVELAEVDRKRVLYHFDVHDQSGEIGLGKHERFVVDSDKFLKKAQEKLV